jgi:hypothetical protein
MSFVHALLAADARRTGRGVRSALLRHRHIAPRPMGISLWQLGAEPYTAAAVAWGFGPHERHVVVPGEPRDRALAFEALAAFARAFNAWFEGPRSGLPQIVVPNAATLGLLLRLGRRLAFLPEKEPGAADPDLVRLGRHLWWLGRHVEIPGQQLVVVLTGLLASHWVTELSAFEAENLPALDAAIDPAAGLTGYEAAVAVERDPQRSAEIGPMPSAEDDEIVRELLDRFLAARRRPDADLETLRASLRAHYERCIDRGWPLLWKCLARERAFDEAAHVERRVLADREALDRHQEWVRTHGGHYRRVQTAVQAAKSLQELEEAHALVTAEEALDDRLRMLPYLANGQAIGGQVVSVDLTNTERKINKVKRPLVVVATAEPCVLPIGKELYWADDPGGRPFEVIAITATPVGGSLVTLKRTTPFREVGPPGVGDEAIFSVHHTGGGQFVSRPAEEPWTHRAPADLDQPASLEDAEEAYA